MCPVVRVAIPCKNNIKSRSFNFLLDTGSNVNIINHDLVKTFHSTKSSSVKTFSCFNQEVKTSSRELFVPLQLPSNKIVKIKMSTVPNFNLNFQYDDLGEQIANLKTHYNLSPNFLSAIDSMKRSSLIVHGIIGIDTLVKHFPFSSFSEDTNHFLQLSNGLLPVGSLQPMQDAFHINSIGSHKSSISNPSQKPHPASRFSKATPKIVSYALQEIKLANKFDVLEDFDAEYLDNKFSLANNYENTNESSSLITYESFKQNISFKNDHYHVNIPFKKDILDRVQSNFSVCRILAQKVNEKVIKIIWKMNTS